MEVAIIGAGNGGQALSAYLALKGCKVNLYNRSSLRIEAVKKIGGIYLSGVFNGFGKLNLVTTSISEAVNDVEFIMIITPAVAHRFLAKELAGVLKDGQKIILNPGRTGGTLEFYNTLRRFQCKADIIVAEAQTFIFASRVIGPAQAKIFGIKNRVSIASFPSNRIREIIDDLSNVIPQFSPVENVLKTSLDNIGAIFHPAPTILNMAWIESTSGNFHYYKDGISPSICKVIEKMDYERIKVAYAFGIEPLSAKDWLRLSYNTKGNNLYELLQNNFQYKGIPAPTCIDHRYVFEDVPMSLVPIASLAEMCYINTPIINMIIDLANLVYGQDFRVEGRTVKSLGLEGLSKKEIINLVNNGSTEDIEIHPVLNRKIIRNVIHDDYLRYRKGVE